MTESTPTRQCPKCDSTISVKARKCPHCGETFVQGGAFNIIAVAAVLFMGGIAVFGENLYIVVYLAVAALLIYLVVKAKREQAQ